MPRHILINPCQQLADDLAAEEARALAAEAFLSADLAAEEARALAAEGTIAANLTTEVSRAIDAEANLATSATAPITKNAAGAFALSLAGAGNLVVSGSSLDTVQGILTTSSPTFQRVYLSTVGTAVAPALSFTGDTNCGLYRAGADSIGLSAAGNVRLTVSATAATLTVPVRAFSGSMGAPGVTFDSGPTSGLFWEDELGVGNHIAVSTDGVRRLDISTTAVVASGVIHTSVGGVGAPAYSFTGYTNSGLYYITASASLAFSTAGTQRATLDSTDFVSSVPFRGPTGGASGPGLSFSSYPTTGIYVVSTGTTLAFATAGTQRASVNSTEFVSTVPIRATDGTASAPGFAFDSDPDMGIYKSGTAIVLSANSGSGVLLDGGAFRRVTGSAPLQLGYSGSAERWETVFATNTTISTSDLRLKQDIRPLSLGLSFVSALRPVTFVWKPTFHTGEDGNQVETAHSRPHVGLIAQEVEAALTAHGHDMSTCDIVSNEHHVDPTKEDLFSMRYEALIGPLIKAVQELAVEVRALAAANAALAARVAALEAA